MSIYLMTYETLGIDLTVVTTFNPRMTSSDQIITIAPKLTFIRKWQGGQVNGTVILQA